MKTLIILVVACSSFFIANAQDLGTGAVISGKVKEVVSEDPVQFAQVLLFDASTDHQVAGTQSLYNGYFEFSNLPAGIYKVRICCNGFETVDLGLIRIQNSGAEFYMGNIALAPQKTDFSSLNITPE